MWGVISANDDRSDAARERSVEHEPWIHWTPTHRLTSPERVGVRIGEWVSATEPKPQPLHQCGGVTQQVHNGLHSVGIARGSVLEGGNESIKGALARSAGECFQSGLRWKLLVLISRGVVILDGFEVGSKLSLDELL
jgi:hypothetical protein